MSTDLTTAKKATGIEALIRQSEAELKMALPSHLSPERLVRIALTTVRMNPKLRLCTPESFLGSLFTLAQIGIEPVAGRAYLIPFGAQVQAIIGYKGLIELFYRHESALSIDMQTVRENDEFSYQYGTDSYLHHKPSMGGRGEAIGYYAVAKMKSSGTVFKFMSVSDAVKHGQKHSKTFVKKTGAFFDDSPWATNLDAMCMKTVLIQLMKTLPLSVELQKAISTDETSRNYKQGITDAFDLPDTTVWAEETEVVSDAKPSNLSQMAEKAKEQKAGVVLPPKLTEFQAKIAAIPEDIRIRAMGELKIKKTTHCLSDDECGKIIDMADMVVANL